MIYIYYELNYNISIYIVIPYYDVLYMRTDVATVTYDHVYTIYNIYSITRDIYNSQMLK